MPKVGAKDPQIDIAHRKILNSKTNSHPVRMIGIKTAVGGRYRKSRINYEASKWYIRQAFNFFFYRISKPSYAVLGSTVLTQTVSMSIIIAFAYFSEECVSVTTNGVEKGRCPYDLHKKLDRILRNSRFHELQTLGWGYSSPACFWQCNFYLNALNLFTFQIECCGAFIIIIIIFF